jgi:hypothetical protein
MKDKSNFNFKSYLLMLHQMQNAGYIIVDYDKVRQQERQVILRHDVDFSLTAAVAMAEEEANAGIQSTYFVLLRTEFYNPFSSSSRSSLKTLRNLGHRIGLHYDAAQHDPGTGSMEVEIHKEGQVLALASDGDISCFSFHRPHPDILAANIAVEGYTNANANNFMKSVGYCSDSRGAWHYGFPLEHQAIKAGTALQLLTHPIWWYQETDREPIDKIASFLDQRCELLETEAEFHCKSYRRRK